MSRLTTGQTMLDILKLLPGRHFSEINIDSLIINGEYYPASNVEEEAIKYTLTDVNDTTGTLTIEMTFVTGQRAFTTRELKRIRVRGNVFIVVYSEVSGAPIAFGQSELETYILKDGKLRKTTENLLPTNIGLADFVKPDTPDSIIEKYNGYSNHCYELIHNKGNNICYVLHENFVPSGIDYSWLLGNTIEFILDKGRFKRLPATFSDE